MKSMTATQARGVRRAVLQASVDAGARCNRMDLDLWFRGDDESAADWQTRRTTAQRICLGCPVRTVCEELALRNGDGDATADELVRAGYTGGELAAIRDHQADRLALAVAADRDTEGHTLDTLTAELHHAATTNPDRSGGSRRIAESQTAQNAQVRHLADQVRQIRTARRTRAGWGTAA
ncbi:WhiB family transcriptional regulator [Streptomyces sp. NPDC052069]|uniref:WhiB family transcriptional regulator n=1 Tax=Streptomyces sp. NPDC052069 TaxID=3154650 RepID=UPI0034459AEB